MAKVTSDNYLKTAAPIAFALTGTATDIANIAASGSILEIDSSARQISNIANVYELVKDGTSFDYYTATTLDKVRANYTVYLYSTLAVSDSDYNGYDIVVFVRN